MSDKFRVQQERPPCEHCGCGGQYTIVFTDENGEEVAIGTSFGSPFDDFESKQAAVRAPWKKVKQKEIL